MLIQHLGAGRLLNHLLITMTTSSKRESAAAAPPSRNQIVSTGKAIPGSVGQMPLFMLESRRSMASEVRPSLVAQLGSFSDRYCLPVGRMFVLFLGLSDHRISHDSYGRSCSCDVVGGLVVISQHGSSFLKPQPDRSCCGIEVEVQHCHNAPLNRHMRGHF